MIFFFKKYLIIYLDKIHVYFSFLTNDGALNPFPKKAINFCLEFSNPTEKTQKLPYKLYISNTKISRQRAWNTTIKIQSHFPRYFKPKVHMFASAWSNEKKLDDKIVCSRETKGIALFFYAFHFISMLFDSPCRYWFWMDFQPDFSAQPDSQTSPLGKNKSLPPTLSESANDSFSRWNKGLKSYW